MADAVDVEITGDSGPLIAALKAAADAAEQLAEIVRQLMADLLGTDGAMSAAGSAARGLSESLATVDATGGAAARALRDVAASSQAAAGATAEDAAATAGLRAQMEGLLGAEAAAAAGNDEVAASAREATRDLLAEAAAEEAARAAADRLGEVRAPMWSGASDANAAEIALEMMRKREEAASGASGALDAAAAAAWRDAAANAADSAEAGNLADGLREAGDAAEEETAKLSPAKITAWLNSLRDAEAEAAASAERLKYNMQSASQTADSTFAQAAPQAERYAAAIENLNRDIEKADASAAAAEEHLRAFESVMAKGGDAFPGAAKALEGFAAEYIKVKGEASGWGAVGAVLVGAGQRISTAWTKATARVRIFGIGFNALHWIVGLSGELLAVAIPAAYALAAGMAVAAEGAQRVAVRMSSLYAVQESMGKTLGQTAGQYLGIGNALQKAQTKAQPRVWQMLGAAISEAKNGASGFAAAGTQVVGFFDKFLAEADVALKSGGFKSLLSGAAQDLKGLGAAFANIGHAIIGWARAMPGLAAVLLRVLDVATRIISVFANSSAGRWAIFLAFGLEEAYRWGGLLATVISKVLIGARFLVETFAALGAAIGETSIGGAIAGAAAGLLGLNRGANAAKVSLGEMDAEAALMSGEMDALAASEGLAAAAAGVLSAAIDFLSGPLGWLAIAAAVGIGFLIDKLVTAKDSVASFYDSLQAGAEKATNLNVLNNLATAYARMGEKASAAKTHLDQLNKTGASSGRWAGAKDPFAIQQAGAALKETTADQQKFAQAAGNVVMGALRIQKAFGTSFVGALGLADEAGIKLMNGITGGSQRAKVAWQQLVNTASGMKAMTGTGGMFGAALNVIGVQAQLAATKVSQLQQATGAFFTQGTAGTQNFTQLVQSVDSLNKHALSTSVSMSGLFGSLRRGAGGLGATFKGLGANALQSWQQFDSALSGPGSNLLQWFQQASAEGMVAKGSLGQAMRDIVGAFLPMAAGSRTATKELSMYAQMAGGPATANSRKLFAWLKSGGQAFKTTGGYLKNLQTIVNGTQIGMAGLQNVAKNLGAMAETIKLKAYGVDKAMQQFADSITSHQSTSQIRAAFGNMQKVLGQAFGPTGQKWGAGYAAGFGKAGQQAAKSFGAGLSTHLKSTTPDIKPKVTVEGIDKAKQQLDQVKQHADKALKNPPDMKVHLTGIDQAEQELQKLKSYTQSVPRSFQQAQSSISGHVSGIVSSVGKLGPAFSRARAAVATQVNAIITAVTPIPARIRAILSPLPGEMQAIGNQIGQGLAAGIRASTGAAVAAAAAMAAAVTRAAQVHLKTHSPSKVFQKIGKNTVQGFIDGLLGGKSAVQAAMNLIFGTRPHNTTIQKWISKMRQEVHAAFKAGVIGAHQESWFTRLIREDNKRLQKLANERKRIENEIKAADALAKSVQSSAETGANVVTSWGQTFLGANQATRSYPTIQKAMAANLANIRKFRADIVKLKKEGLSKQIIRQLLGAGVSGGLPIAEQLLKGGSVREIDKLQKEIDKASRRLGITGANAAYESGKEIGKGLAAGLKSQLRGIEDAMRRIARDLVRAIRKALRIKSPSQVMHEIGTQTALGLAEGMLAAAGLVRSAGARMGASAAQAAAMPMLAAGGGRGGATAPVVLHSYITLKVDGKTLARTTQTQQLRHARRNLSTGLKLSGRNI
jgi:hypothetical protein